MHGSTFLLILSGSSGGGATTTVYFADTAIAPDGGLILPLDAGPVAGGSDGSLLLPFDAGPASGPDGSLTSGYGGDVTAGLDLASWSATLVLADSGQGPDRSIAYVFPCDSGASSESGLTTAVASGFTLVNKTIAGGNTSSVNIPIGWTVAAGDLILVAVALSAGVSIAVSDTAGNTYSLAANVGGPWPAAIYYSVVGTGGSGLSITATFGATVFNGVAVLEYSAPGTISLDTTGTGTGTGTATQPSAPLSLAGSGELVGLLTNVGAGGLTYTPGAGYTVEESYNIGGVKDFAYADALSQSGSATPALTLSSSTTWSAVAASFRFAGSTVVYFADAATGLDRHLSAALAGESSSGSDGSLRSAFGGESAAEAEAWLASLTTAEYAADAGAESEGSLRLATAGEPGSAPDVASWASTLHLGDSAVLASAGLSIAILGDPGMGVEAIPLLTRIQAAFAGTDEGIGAESWSIVVVSDIPRAYWFAPEAARLVPIDRMDPDAFEVDPYAARLVVIAAMDADSFEVDPYAARVITP